MTREGAPYLELFGRCTQGHRARLVYYDGAGRHQEFNVHMSVFGAGRSTGAVNVYRVTCPACGEAYTTTDRGVERVET
jgi:hypothetical protein